MATPGSNMSIVSIHATQEPTICYKTYFGFNPRICKRCDIRLTDAQKTQVVSIHASVKDATSLRNFIMFRSFVSIHASVKDAT